MEKVVWLLLALLACELISSRGAIGENTTLPAPPSSGQTTIPAPTSSGQITLHAPVPSGQTTLPAPVPSGQTTIPAPVPSGQTIPAPVPSGQTTIPAPPSSGQTTIPAPTSSGQTTLPAPVASGQTTIPAPTSSEKTTSSFHSLPSTAYFSTAIPHTNQTTMLPNSTSSLPTLSSTTRQASASSSNSSSATSNTPPPDGTPTTPPSTPPSGSATTALHPTSSRQTNSSSSSLSTTPPNTTPVTPLLIDPSGSATTLQHTSSKANSYSSSSVSSPPLNTDPSTSPSSYITPPTRSTTPIIHTTLPLKNLVDWWDDDDDRPITTTPPVPLHNCSLGQVVDQNTELCRPLYCPEGKIINQSADDVNGDDSSCVTSLPATSLYGYDLCFLDNQPLGTFNKMYGFVYDLEFQEYMEFLSQFASRINEFLYSIGIDISFVSFDVLTFQTEEELAKSPVPDTYYLYSFELVSFSKAGRDARDQMVVKNLHGLQSFFMDMFNSSTLRLSPSCDEQLMSYLMMKDKPVLASYLMSFFDFPNDIVRDLFSHVQLFLPLAETITCPSVQLHSEEFQYDHLSNQLVMYRIKNGSKAEAGRVQMPYYHIVNPQEAYVCLSKYQTKKVVAKEEEKEESVMGVVLFWVSLLSLVVSIVFLFVSFLVYCLLPSLRTVAGINNLILIISLFWAQLLLLIGTYVRLVDWLCQVVGVATHFFWLLVIFAQNVCTFHMFYTLAFPLQSHVAMASPRKMTRRYVQYVVSMATAFVVAVLVWQFAAEGHSGYGKKYSCYISSAVVRMSMFAAPLAATVIANLAMFVVTVVRLRSLQHVESTRSNRISLIMYTKLSVLTGLTWLLAFIDSLVGSDVLTFVYVIAQGCQGLFIFLAFLTKKTVVSMLRERLCGKKAGKSSSRPTSTRSNRSTNSHTRTNKGTASPPASEAGISKEEGLKTEDVEAVVAKF